MTYFLAIQNTYTDLQIALFKDNICLENIQTDKKTASRDCILLLESVLKKHHLNFQQMQFITVNQGPGPFTTLRVVIATVNGLSFATQIPLIGINALDALLSTYPSKLPTVALLNAFGNDAYYAIRALGTNNLEYGCASIGSFLEIITEKFSSEVLFIGNGAQIHKEKIENALGKKACFLDPIPETCSIEEIGKLGLQVWEQQSKSISKQLQPIYLKQASY